MGRLFVGVVVAALGVAALLSNAGAQEAADVTLVPRQATVGDRLTLAITVRHASDVELEAPEPEAFAPLDLLEVRPAETRDISERERETKLEFVLTAFLTGEVRLLPIELRSTTGEVIATAEAPPVAIESVLPADATELRDVTEPLQAATGPPTWVWAALIMAGFAGLTIVTMALARIPTLERPPPIEEPPREERPEDIARRELDAIGQAGLLDRGEAVEYYRRIAACLRAYLSRRLDIAAAALTPHELAERLEAVDIDRLAARLAVNTLEQCEAVQFAGYEPVRERAEADLSGAREVVSLTTVEPVGQREQGASARP